MLSYIGACITILIDIYIIISYNISDTFDISDSLFISDSLYMPDTPDFFDFSGTPDISDISK